MLTKTDIMSAKPMKVTVVKRNDKCKKYFVNIFVFLYIFGINKTVAPDFLLFDQT